MMYSTKRKGSRRQPTRRLVRWATSRTCTLELIKGYSVVARLLRCVSLVSHFDVSSSQGEFNGKWAAATATSLGNAGVDQAAVFQHRLHARFASKPRGIHLVEIFRVSTREHHLPETGAVRQCQAAMVFEPLESIVIQHFAPQISVVAGGIIVSPDVHEVAGTVTRRHVAQGNVGIRQRLHFKCIR